MSDDKLVFNGINARSGGYLMAPTDEATLYKIALGETFDPGELAELKAKIENEDHFGVIEGVDPKKLDEAGWGVIFPAAETGSEAEKNQAAIRDALAPLLNWRRAQATQKHAHYYKDYVGDLAYRPGESKTQFLTRQGVGPGPANPDKVPYYLLIVASPQEIPFTFQYQLDIQYAVGRIHFEDVEDYAHYANSVVTAEKENLTLARRAAFWGVANEDDRATQTSAQHLTGPLADWLATTQQANGWTVDRFMRDGANKSAIAELLGGKTPPALLFTASHGVAFESGDELQHRHQGALLCGDWPGPRAWTKPIADHMYFSGDDLGADAQLHGLLAFFFACYGGGSPRYDEFSKRTSRNKRTQVAPQPFVAGLPKRMLSHPKGGALAVAAHVDRAWGTSFLWSGTKDDQGTPAQRAVFESALKSLVEGHPIGSAFDVFNERYAELSSDLALKIEDIEFGADYPDKERDLARMWTANNDARGYTIIGDPAVRMCTPRNGETNLAPSAGEVSSSLDRAQDPPVSTAPTKTGETSEVPPSESVSFATGDPTDADPNTERMIESFNQLMQSVLQDAEALEIRTYAAKDTTAVGETPKTQALDSEPQLQALTRIQMNGNVEVWVPLDKGTLDPQLAELHKAMVNEGQKHRVEMLKLAMAWLKERVE